MAALMISSWPLAAPADKRRLQAVGFLHVIIGQSWDSFEMLTRTGYQGSTLTQGTLKGVHWPVVVLCTDPRVGLFGFRTRGCWGPGKDLIYKPNSFLKR